MDNLQGRYQQCLQQNQELKKRVKQNKRDFNAERERLLKRYVNGERVSNAFHILTDQLSSKTVQQYGPLIPLLEKVVRTFNTTVTEKCSTDFVYGYLAEKDGQFYVSDRQGRDCHPLIIAGLSKATLATIKDGVAIKVQRVDRQHYYLVTTMPWVNEMLNYLKEQGSVQPNRLVKTSGTTKLSHLLATHIPPLNSNRHVAVSRVVLGKAILVRTQREATATSQVIPVINHRRLEDTSERVMIVNPNKLAWLYQQKVLLIGNKKIDPLVDQLRKYVNLTVMDAYEESLDLIFKRMWANDFIFVLLGSVTHAVTDYLKQHPELDERIQRFYRADANEGVRRLNYLYENWHEK